MSPEELTSFNSYSNHQRQARCLRLVTRVGDHLDRAGEARADRNKRLSLHNKSKEATPLMGRPAPVKTR